jgi:hypothetical protein
MAGVIPGRAFLRASPESIATGLAMIARPGVMDSGLAGFARAPE